MNPASKQFKPNDLHYKMMGRELWNKLPLLATSLLKPYLSADPFDYNFTKIEDHYLFAFCSLYGITKKELQGALFKSSKVDIRRLFIASMVHIYCPHVYFQHSSEINLSKRGFVMWLSKALDQQESNVSVLIREVVAWEKDYEEFKDRVSLIVEKLKNIA
jgi:hypothetical protein